MAQVKVTREWDGAVPLPVWIDDDPVPFVDGEWERNFRPGRYFLEYAGGGDPGEKVKIVVTVDGNEAFAQENKVGLDGAVFGQGFFHV